MPYKIEGMSLKIEDDCDFDQNFLSISYNECHVKEGMSLNIGDDQELDNLIGKLEKDQEKEQSKSPEPEPTADDIFKKMQNAQDLLYKFLKDEIKSEKMPLSDEVKNEIFANLLSNPYLQDVIKRNDQS